MSLVSHDNYDNHDSIYDNGKITTTISFSNNDSNNNNVDNNNNRFPIII